MLTTTTSRSDQVSGLNSRAFSGTSRQVFRRFREEDCDLALWERALPAPAALLCAEWVSDPGFVDLDVSGEPGPALSATLLKHPLFTRAADHPVAHWILDDVGFLATVFTDLAECGKVRVRLSKVSDHGCAAFHIDNLPVRLLCTYAGQGMQWAGEPHVRRTELGLRGRTTEETNTAIVPDAAHIRTVPTGAVALFKGRLGTSGQGHGLIHRSYPVCCSDHSRLRLVIDPAGHAY